MGLPLYCRQKLGQLGFLIIIIYCVGTVWTCFLFKYVYVPQIAIIENINNLLDPDLLPTTYDPTQARKRIAAMNKQTFDIHWHNRSILRWIISHDTHRMIYTPTYDLIHNYRSLFKVAKEITREGVWNIIVNIIPNLSSTKSNYRFIFIPCLNILRLGCMLFVQISSAIFAINFQRSKIEREYLPLSHLHITEFIRAIVSTTMSGMVMSDWVGI